MVEIHFTDDRTQSRHDHVADGLDIIFHPIDGFDRIGDLDEGDRIDDDDGIVAGNNFLLLDIKDDVLGCDPVAIMTKFKNALPITWTKAILLFQ